MLKSIVFCSAGLFLSTSIFADTIPEKNIIENAQLAIILAREVPEFDPLSIYSASISPYVCVDAPPPVEHDNAPGFVSNAQRSFPRISTKNTQENSDMPQTCSGTAVYMTANEKRPCADGISTYGVRTGYAIIKSKMSTTDVIYETYRVQEVDICPAPSNK